MKPFFLKILLPYCSIISLLCVLLDPIITNYLALNSELSGAYKINRITKLNELPPEVSIIGSSRAKCCYIPDSLSKSAFNYGLNFAGYNVSEFFIKNALKAKSDKPIIVNVEYAWSSSTIGVVSNYIPSAQKKEVKILLGAQYQWWYHLPTIRYYGTIATYLREFAYEKFGNQASMQGLSQDTNHGAKLIGHALSPKKMKKMLSSAEAINSAFKGKVLERLKILVQAYPERHFIFVVIPYHPNYFENAQNVESARQDLAQFNTLENATVLDYANSGFPDSLFFDLTHLNKQGSMLFNQRLKADLKKIRPALNL